MDGFMWHPSYPLVIECGVFAMLVVVIGIGLVRRRATL